MFSHEIRLYFQQFNLDLLPEWRLPLKVDGQLHVSDSKERRSPPGPPLGLILFNVFMNDINFSNDIIY